MNFVTGATGLLGAHLLFKLCSEKQEVKAVYRNEERIQNVKKLFIHYDPIGGERLFHSIRWMKGDILDISFLDRSIEPNDKVYHCAAVVSFDAKDFHLLIKVNREGTENVVNTCLAKGVSKLCHVSSTAAVGTNSGGLISEEDQWKKTPKTSAYSISKFNAERAVWRGISEGLNAVIINPCVILGAGNWEESSLAIFKTVSKGVSYYPPGANATVDARDVAEAMYRLMESEIHSERFLCVGSNQKFRDLIAEIARHTNTKKPKKEAKLWQVNTVYYLSSIVSFFTRKRPAITRDNINNLFATKIYSNKKLKEAVKMEFRPIEEQVKNGVQGRLDQSQNS
jgi:nucleoside-diphosphate-sugar epimerase